MLRYASSPLGNGLKQESNVRSERLDLSRFGGTVYFACEAAIASTNG